MFKKLLIPSLCSVSFAMAACSTQSNIIQSSKPDIIQIQKTSNLYVADIGHGKTGASFRTTINFSEGFKVKNNLDGTPAKVNSDIASVDAYLLELAASPAAGSDPLASSFGSVMNIAKTSSGSFTILFQNVPANNTGKRYFVGLVTKDSGGTVISRNPAVDWTGSSANTGLAVTNGGGDPANPGSITVDTNFSVSNAADLTIGIALLDAVGAQIESQATVTNGADKTAADIQAN